MKTCSKCGIEKQESEFYPVKKGRSRTWCKECERTYQRELYRDPAKVKARSENWAKKYQKCYSKKRKEDRERFYVYELKHKYGLSQEEAERLLKTNGKHCAICGIDFNSKTALTRRNFDHCHITGKPGTFICSRCNTVLGLVQDSGELLGKLKEYIERYR